MSEIELLPCPFCGGKINVSGSPITRDIKTANHPSNDCILSGHNWWHVPRFIGPWNTRAPSAELIAARKRIAEMNGALDSLLDAITASDMVGDRSLTITGPTANLKWLLEAEEEARDALGDAP